uniref:Uncharacterized protein n=1 Tax=Oryza punctata TaxID=4537 RepID=A0A0E0M5D3_ORYPU
MRGRCDFDFFMPSTIVANVVHWLTPLDISEFMLFLSKDGILGFTGVLGSHIILFHLDIASDALTAIRTKKIYNVIPVDHFFLPYINILGTQLLHGWWSITSLTPMKEKKKNKVMTMIMVMMSLGQCCTHCNETHELHKILVPADTFDNIHEANLSIVVPKNCEVSLTTVSGYILQLWTIHNYTHDASTWDLRKIVMLNALLPLCNARLQPLPAMMKPEPLVWIMALDEDENVGCRRPPYRVLVALNDQPSYCLDEWNLEYICAKVWILEMKV